jgi:hypothetical protein
LPLNPERGADGEVIPHDDLAILPESMLVRHINPKYHVVPDENTKGRRITSAAFAATGGDPHHGMSVDVNQLLSEQQLPPAHMVVSGMGAVSLVVAELREKGLQVGSDPVPANEFHGQVWGVKKSVRNIVQKLVKDWVVPIDGVAIR